MSEKWDISVFNMLIAERNRCARVIGKIHHALNQQPDAERQRLLERDLAANQRRIETIEYILNTAPEEIRGQFQKEEE